jgi:hypothetical protein
MTAGKRRRDAPAPIVLGADALLRGPFRRAYVANAVNQLGGALLWVALLWYSVEKGGALGVLAVRLATTVPLLLFTLHGGLIADRWDRRTTVIGANLVAAAALVPATVVGIVGTLPLWQFAAAGFVVATTGAYFLPAFGSLVPSLVGRPRVQQANALVNATDAVLSIGGLALAAAILAATPIGIFFGITAASFVASALLLTLVPRGARAAPAAGGSLPIREGFTVLRLRVGLTTGIVVLATGMAVMTGVWTIGVADLARNRFDGAGDLSLLLLATTVGEIGTSFALSRRAVGRKVFASTLSWTLLLPAFLLIGFGTSLPVALAGTALVGMASAAGTVLIVTATQESVPEGSLGRALGVVYLANTGSKPFGLLVLGPLYAVLSPATVFVLGGAVVFACALVGAASVNRATRAARAIAPLSEAR